MAHVVSDANTPDATTGWMEDCGGWSSSHLQVTVQDAATEPAGRGRGGGSDGGASVVCVGVEVSELGSCDAAMGGCYTALADEMFGWPQYTNANGYWLYNHAHRAERLWRIDSSPDAGDELAHVTSNARTPPEDGWQDQCDGTMGSSPLRLGVSGPVGQGAGGSGGASAADCAGVVVSGVGSRCDDAMSGCYTRQAGEENNRPVYVNEAGAGYVLHCIIHGRSDGGQWRWVIEVGRVGATGERMASIDSGAGSTTGTHPDWALTPPAGSPSNPWWELCSSRLAENAQLRVVDASGSG